MIGYKRQAKVMVKKLQVQASDQKKAKNAK